MFLSRMNRSHFLRLVLTAPWALQHLGAEEVSRDPRGAALYFLLGSQSADGAWRSETYGAFRSGHALTPIVLRALSHFLEQERVVEACARGVKWLLAQQKVWLDCYPVHLASAMLETLPKLPALLPLEAQAVDRLWKLQLGREAGWAADHPSFGGWAYAPVAAKPEEEIPAMQQPNLSATVMALDGLCAVGKGSSAIKDARAFLLHCQNYGTGDDRFDDGGFFQVADDPARNKAGRSGVDRGGRMRLRSYASATSDGLRGLHHCRDAGDRDRITAAVRWLRMYRWSASGQENSPADLIYYAARSITVSARLVPEVRKECAELPALLAAGQKRNGSWQNPSGEMREDCPLVATALALEACKL